MRIIGLMGRAGAGKDTVADIIGSVVQAHRWAFADALKAEIAAAYHIDPRTLSARRLKEQPLSQLSISRCADKEFAAYADHLRIFLGLKPRTLLQTWGDWRRSQDIDYFARRADGALIDARVNGAEVMVLTDVRFWNEAAWVLRHGGALWRIQRRELEPVSSHLSEYGLDHHQPDVLICNDGTLDDLRRMVVDLVDNEVQA